MIRFKRLTGRRDVGFSFIELLVTIVIAGIAFLAMVPLFVTSSKASANDKSRVVALNIAQDRIEKVRRLDFESLTYDDLNVSDSTSPFATTQYEQTQAGTKPFTVACQVQDLPVSATDPRVVSRKVTVTVSWTTPTPGGSVSISTIVYRQFVGPQITNFTVSNYDPIKDWISAATVTLTVTVNPADVASMAPVTLGSRKLTGYVLITISPVNGSAVLAAIQIPYHDTVPKTTFVATWTVPNGAGLGDGYYKFTAVAYTANKSAGNTWTFSKRVETAKPGPVSNLTGTASETQAVLTWSPSVSADVVDYEVTRTDPDGTVHILAGDPTKTPLLVAQGYTDTSALALHQTYRYTVTAYDQSGLPSDAVSQDLYVWSASELGGPPLPATALTGVGSANFANLSWTASASPLVLGYQVYAQDHTTVPVMTVSAPSAAVPQAWNTTAWYQVKPYRLGALLSADWASILSPTPVHVAVDGVPWVQVKTQVQTLYTFTIVNDASASNEKADISLWYLGPTGQSAATQVGATATNIQNGRSAQWTAQPYGTYRWSWVTTDNPSRTGQREESFAVGPGDPVLVPRHCIAVP